MFEHWLIRYCSDDFTDILNSELQIHFLLRPSLFGWKYKREFFACEIAGGSTAISDCLSCSYDYVSKIIVKKCTFRSIPTPCGKSSEKQWIFDSASPKNRDNTYSGGQTLYLIYIYLYRYIYWYQQVFSMDKAVFQLLYPSTKGSDSRFNSTQGG